MNHSPIQMTWQAPRSKPRSKAWAATLSVLAALVAALALAATPAHATTTPATKVTDAQSLAQALNIDNAVTLEADTLTLKTNVTVATSAEPILAIDLNGQNLTLDLADHTLTVAANKMLQLVDSTGTGSLTLAGTGTFTGANDGSPAQPIFVGSSTTWDVAGDKGAKLVLDGPTVQNAPTGDRGNALAVMGQGSTFVLLNGTVQTKSTADLGTPDPHALYGIYAGVGAKVVISGGTVSGQSVGIGTSALSSNPGCSVTVEGGTVTGSDAGIYAPGQSGSSTPNKVTISGGTVQGTATPSAGVLNAGSQLAVSGSATVTGNPASDGETLSFPCGHVPGAGIAAVEGGNYGTAGSTSVTGGTVNGGIANGGGQGMADATPDLTISGTPTINGPVTSADASAAVVAPGTVLDSLLGPGSLAEGVKSVTFDPEAKTFTYNADVATGKGSFPVTPGKPSVVTFSFEQDGEAAANAMVAAANAVGKPLTIEQLKAVGTPVDNTMFALVYGDPGASYDIYFGTPAPAAPNSPAATTPSTVYNEHTDELASPLLLTFFAFKADGTGEGFPQGSPAGDWAKGPVAAGTYTAAVTAGTEPISTLQAWPADGILASSTLGLGGITYAYSTSTAGAPSVAATTVPQLAVVNPDSPADLAVFATPEAVQKEFGLAPAPTAPAGTRFLGWYLATTAADGTVDHAPYAGTSESVAAPTAVSLVAGYTPVPLAKSSALAVSPQHVVSTFPTAATLTVTLGAASSANITLAAAKQPATAPTADATTQNQLFVEALAAALQPTDGAIAGIDFKLGTSEGAAYEPVSVAIANAPALGGDTVTAALTVTPKGGQATVAMTVNLADLGVSGSVASAGSTGAAATFAVVDDVAISYVGKGTVAQATDGTTMTLTATPAPGWEFGGWQVKSASGVVQTVSTENPFTFTAGLYDELTAVFEPLPYVKVYRVYNPYDHEHLFTTDQVEYDSLVASGWNDEGVAWNAPETGIAVYRLYNPWSHDHYYTVSRTEGESLAALGWTWDNGGDALFYSAKSGVEVYQLFNPYETTNTHLWTTDFNEYAVLKGLGWNQEGVKFHGVSLPE